MKIDVTRVLNDLDGLPIKEGEKDITFGLIAQRALLGADPAQERGIAAEESFKRYNLAKRIHDAAGECELTTEEASLIKQRSALLFMPLVVGRMCEIIEGK